MGVSSAGGGHGSIVEGSVNVAGSADSVTAGRGDSISGNSSASKEVSCCEGDGGVGVMLPSLLLVSSCLLLDCFLEEDRGLSSSLFSRLLLFFFFLLREIRFIMFSE